MYPKQRGISIVTASESVMARKFLALQRRSDYLYLIPFLHNMKRKLTRAIHKNYYFHHKTSCIAGITIERNPGRRLPYKIRRHKIRRRQNPEATKSGGKIRTRQNPEASKSGGTSTVQS